MSLLMFFAFKGALPLAIDGAAGSHDAVALIIMLRETAHETPQSMFQRFGAIHVSSDGECPLTKIIDLLILTLTPDVLFAFFLL
jgi:hypothetical protein